MTEQTSYFSGALTRWLERENQSVRQLSLTSGVHDSDLSRIKDGTKRITRDSLGKLLSSELLDNVTRLEFLRAYLKDQIPEGELREGESFASHTEISFPNASITVSEMSPLDEALHFFRNLAETDHDTYDWLVTMRRLLKGGSSGKETR